MKKLILHLCADLGSDSIGYQLDDSYDVICIGKEYGVENYKPDKPIYGVIANPPCTEFSTATNFKHIKNIELGMYLVNECLRIIKESNPHFWVLENPANGKLKDILGPPKFTYQPWQFGSPWTKKTALWGEFDIPKPIFKDWESVPKIEGLYIKPRRQKPSLVDLHKNDIRKIKEFKRYEPFIKTDADLRSLCSQGFAHAFKKVNP